MSQINIRLATLNDLSSIRTLNHALFTFESTLPDHDTYNLNWMFETAGIKYFAKRLQQKAGFILVAQTQKQQIVGYIAIGIDVFAYRTVGPIAEIENMFVLGKYRRQHIGTNLVKEAVKKAKSLGAHHFRVEAAHQNNVALAFYRSIGFSDFNLIMERSAHK